jgi:SNF2 family DNA or RNA helicase
MDPEAFDSAVPVDGAFSTAWRELGEAKAPEVLAYARELLEGGVEKLVVGAWHKTVLHYLRYGLAEYGVAYMDGSTSSRRKQAEVDRFQNDPDCRIILGQIKSMGEGWTLTQAQDALLAEPHPVPGKNEQFFDRIHREGQKGDHVICHVPVVPDSLDERMLARAIEKDISINEALDGQ